MRILIAIDGSQHSQYAISSVMDRVWPKGTAIHLVHIESDSRVHVGSNGEQMTGAEILSALAAGIQSRMDSVAVDYEVIKSNNTTDAIVIAANHFDADLIVVGCRGGSTIECLLLGSISQELLDKAPCPVMVAKPLEKNGRENILVAMDDCIYAAIALEWLLRQEWAAKYAIYLVSVMEPLSTNFHIGENITKASDHLLAWEKEKYAREYALSQWKAIVEKHLPDADVYFHVLIGEPRKVILDDSHDWPASLILTGSHGRTGLSKLVLGSVSAHITTHANCPVIVVRGKQSQYFEKMQALVEQQTHSMSQLLTRRPASCTKDFAMPHVPMGMG